MWHPRMHFAAANSQADRSKNRHKQKYKYRSTNTPTEAALRRNIGAAADVPPLTLTVSHYIAWLQKRSRCIVLHSLIHSIQGKYSKLHSNERVLSPKFTEFTKRWKKKTKNKTNKIWLQHSEGKAPRLCKQSIRLTLDKAPHQHHELADLKRDHAAGGLHQLMQWYKGRY